MAKIHARQGKNGSPACAARGVDSRGNVVRNGRQTYQFMASEVVGPNEFVDTNPADRCAHCCDRFTPMMNARNARLGLPLFADALTRTLKD